MSLRENSKNRIYSYPNVKDRAREIKAELKETKTIPPDDSNSYEKLLTMLAKEKNTTEVKLQEMLNKIAFHETGMTMDPMQKQGGEGPGLGLFQYEPESLVTAKQRAVNFYTNNKINIPDFVTNMDLTDATKMTATQQNHLALIDMYYRKNFNMANSLVSDANLTKEWAKGWQTKNDPTKIQNFEDHTKIFNANNPSFEKVPPKPINYSYGKFPYNL
jgi:hypothetical protein